MMNKQFSRFIRSARKRAQFWRLLLGLVVMTVVYLAGVVTILALVRLFGGRPGTPSAEISGLDTPAGTLLLLASFLGMALAPIVAVRLIHKRTIASLFGPAATVIRDFVFAAGVVAAISVLFQLFWSLFFDPVPNLGMKQWLALLPLALVGILVQSGAEELVFRSYLMQQLAARFRSPLIWMIAPGLIFAMLHYDPGGAGQNTWLVIAAAGVFALVASDLTRLTGSIGAAWGFHFANNVVAIAIIAVDGTIPGLALFLTPYNADDTALLPSLISVDIALMLLAWLILRSALPR